MLITQDADISTLVTVLRARFRDFEFRRLQKFLVSKHPICKSTKHDDPNFQLQK
jgi:predicted Zn-ribbon and HTH transcriptional regulator